MSSKILPRDFYARSVVDVAKDLVGMRLVRIFDSKRISGIILETEAYDGENDLACHARIGKTKRNAVMFGEPGHAYVYFTYGMHFCANVVTGNEGTGEAVLIRAVEPLAGIEVMKINRYGSNKSLNLQSLNRKSFINLTNGPAKFCQAFGIERKENGTDLLDSEISITEGESILSKYIKRSSRIGIQQGVEKNWRFFIRGNQWLSKK